MLKQFLLSLSVFSAIGFSACSSLGGLSVDGNEGGSIPVNEQEKIEYQKAIIRCNKTGGSRIVKIEGQLRCF